MVPGPPSDDPAARRQTRAVNHRLLARCLTSRRSGPRQSGERDGEPTGLEKAHPPTSRAHRAVGAWNASRHNATNKSCSRQEHHCAAQQTDAPLSQRPEADSITTAGQCTGRPCNRCQRRVANPATLKMHQRSCLGAAMGECPFCHRRRSAANMARHKAGCKDRPTAPPTQQQPSTTTTTTTRATAECERCGRRVQRRNLARHRRTNECRSQEQAGEPTVVGEGGANTPTTLLSEALAKSTSRPDSHNSWVVCDNCGRRVGRTYICQHRRGPCPGARRAPVALS